MDDISELLEAYRTLCQKARIEPLPAAEIEEWLRAILADRIIGSAPVH